MSEEEAPDPGPQEGEGEEREFGLERRLQRLEEIARELEKGEVGLEAALTLFEEGVRHVRSSQELISRAELRVNELVGEGEDAESRPMETPDSGSEPENAGSSQGNGS